MKYKITYQYPSKVFEGIDENGNDIYSFELRTAVQNDISEVRLDSAIAAAKAEAYNGEVTVDELPDPELSTADKIAILKEQLSSTDYKIIKCSEAQLVGEELPYDIAALHAERQAIRDQINELEGSEN